jgi:hypothetical protein
MSSAVKYVYLLQASDLHMNQKLLYTLLFMHRMLEILLPAGMALGWDVEAAACTHNIAHEQVNQSVHQL